MSIDLSLTIHTSKRCTNA